MINNILIKEEEWQKMITVVHFLVQYFLAHYIPVQLLQLCQTKLYLMIFLIIYPIISLVFCLKKFIHTFNSISAIYSITTQGQIVISVLQQTSSVSDVQTHNTDLSGTFSTSNTHKGLSSTSTDSQPDVMSHQYNSGMHCTWIQIYCWIIFLNLYVGYAMIFLIIYPKL